MSEVNFNGVVHNDPKGQVKLSKEDDGFFQACCDCGLVHFVKTDGKTFEFEKIDNPPAGVIPAGKKFPLRESLAIYESKMKELEAKFACYQEILRASLNWENTSLPNDEFLEYLRTAIKRVVDDNKFGDKSIQKFDSIFERFQSKLTASETRCKELEVSNLKNWEYGNTKELELKSRILVLESRIKELEEDKHKFGDLLEQVVHMPPKAETKMVLVSPESLAASEARKELEKILEEFRVIENVFRKASEMTGGSK